VVLHHVQEDHDQEVRQDEEDLAEIVEADDLNESSLSLTRRFCQSDV
jgi:hypothetical protein